MMMKLRTAVTAIALTSFLIAPAGWADNSDQAPPKLQMGARNGGDGAQFYGEATEQIPQEGTSEPGAPPSQEHPDVTASEPSMWDEKPHQKCTDNGDEHPEIHCVNNGLLQPSGPEEPTGGPRTITITTRQAATLIAQGSGITRQPPGPKVIISKAFIVYTDPTPRYQTTTILDTAIDVEFTPISYTWNWGDGTTTTTTDPGAPYPNHTVTHHYKHTDKNITTTLTTTWTTRYRPTGHTNWHTIEGTITTTETSTPYDLVRIVTYLTDDAEEAQGH